MPPDPEPTTLDLIRGLDVGQYQNNPLNPVASPDSQPVYPNAIDRRKKAVQESDSPQVLKRAREYITGLIQQNRGRGQEAEQGNSKIRNDPSSPGTDMVEGEQVTGTQGFEPRFDQSGPENFVPPNQRPPQQQDPPPSPGGLPQNIANPTQNQGGRAPQQRPYAESMYNMLQNAQQGQRQQGQMPASQEALNNMSDAARRQLQAERASQQPGQSSTYPGAMSDYVEDASGDVVKLPPGASDEQIQAVLDSGKRPVISQDLSGVEKFEEIDVDFSRSKEAVRDFADAKVKAAKKGALASRVGAENANTRLMANALGPGLFQALTATQQPTNRGRNLSAAADRSVRKARQAQSQAQQTAELAPAEAERRVAQIDRQERQKQRQSDRQTQQLNNQQERELQKAQTDAQMRYVNSVYGMAQKERQRERKRLLREQKRRLENNPNINPNQVQTVQQLTRNLNSTADDMRKLGNAASVLRNPDEYTEQQVESTKRALANDFTIVDGNPLSMGEQKLADAVAKMHKDLRADYQSTFKKRATITSGADPGAFGGSGYMSMGNPGSPTGQDAGESSEPTGTIPTPSEAGGNSGGGDNRSEESTGSSSDLWGNI
jgi:hypothetical protein